MLGQKKDTPEAKFPTEIQFQTCLYLQAQSPARSGACQSCWQATKVISTELRFTLLKTLIYKNILGLSISLGLQWIYSAKNSLTSKPSAPGTCEPYWITHWTPLPDRLRSYSAFQRIFTNQFSRFYLGI
jgi:hypothetical protein